MKKYDGLYIFAGLARDGNVDALVEKMQGEITRLQGRILKSAVLGKRTFARPMRKQENGVYARIRFELDPEQLKALTDRYHLQDDVFRVQILAVDERREARLAEQDEVFRAREAAREAAAAQQAAAAEQAATAPGA